MFLVASKTYNDWDVDMLFINMETQEKIHYSGYDIDENGEVIEQGQTITYKTYQFLTQ